VPQFEVTSPEGRKFRVTAPEGTTKDEALAHVQKQQAPPVAELPKQDTASPPQQGWADYLTEGAGAFGKGLVLSPYLAGQQAIAKVGEALSVGPKSMAMNQQRYAEATERAQTEEKAGGLPYMAGQMAPALLAGPAGLARAAIVGAGTSLAAPTTGEGSYIEQKAMQGAVGTAGGTAGGLLGMMLRPSATPAAKKLIDQGVPLTAGQGRGRVAHAIETFASKSPVVGGPVRSKQMQAIAGYNRAMYNSALSSIGQKVPPKVEVGHPGIAVVEKIIQKEYDTIVPKLTVVVDLDLVKGVETIQKGAAKWAGEDGQKAAKFLSYLVEESSARAGSAGAMPGGTYQAIRSDLKQRLAKLPAEGYYADDLRKAVSGVIKELDNAAKRSNPAHAAKLDQIDKAYAKLVVLRRAAARDTSIDGVFSPKEVRKAVIKGRPESSIARGTVPGQAEAEEAATILRRPSTTESAYPNFLLGVPRAVAGGIAAVPTLAPQALTGGAAAARVIGAAGAQRYNSNR